jgi:hypothetical protein
MTHQCKAPAWRGLSRVSRRPIPRPTLLKSEADNL